LVDVSTVPIQLFYLVCILLVWQMMRIDRQNLYSTSHHHHLTWYLWAAFHTGYKVRHYYLLFCIVTLYCTLIWRYWLYNRRSLGLWGGTSVRELTNGLATLPPKGGSRSL